MKTTAPENAITREEVEEKGRFLISLKKRRDALLALPLSKADVIKKIRAALANVAWERKQKMKDVLTGFTPETVLEPSVFSFMNDGPRPAETLLLAESVLNEIECGKLNREEIAAKVDLLNEQIHSLEVILNYSSESPAWPAERLIRNELGEVFDAWHPGEDELKVTQFSLARWLELLEEEETDSARR